MCTLCSKEIIALTQALIEQKRNGPDAIHHLHLLVLSNLPTHKGANISHSPSFVAIVEKTISVPDKLGGILPERLAVSIIAS